MIKQSTLLLLFFYCALSFAQKMPVDYRFGEKYDDRYKYSNLLTIDDDGNGGSVLVRSYYSGMILKPKGYFIELYNKDLELTAEYNYKLKGKDFINGFIKNGQLYLLFLEYNIQKSTYDYVVRQSPLDEFSFSKRTILSIPSKEVDGPLDKNYYNRNFVSGFTTSVLFDENKEAFAISAHFKKGKDNNHFVYVFRTNLTKVMEYDMTAKAEEKNYAFEGMSVTKDLNNVYLVGKAYFRKKRFSALERKFQYELIRISANQSQSTSFDEPGKFLEAIKPIVTGDKLICVGFYANRKDNKYNGLTYFDLDQNSLAVNTKKYHPFSAQFMKDKFGKDDDESIKNLVFKNALISDDGSILFNAEEYFATTGYQDNPGGSRIRVTRYHYNDMVGAKLNTSGDLVWVRNINKTEVTQQDGAYASYSSFTKDNNTYFFISTAAENPQQISNQRIMFKQGYSRNRNVFLIKLDAKGDMSYEKIIDAKEARLPLMVSKPLIINDDILFYAKRGSKKQLVKVGF